MTTKKPIAYTVAAVATIFLSVLRIVVAPTLGISGGFLSVLLFVLVPLTVAALLYVTPRLPAAALPSGGSLLSFGAVFAGVLSLLYAVWTFSRWKQAGEWPFPAPTNPTTLSAVLLMLLCLFALLGGLFLIMQGIAWIVGKPLRGWLSLFSLAPLAWTWVRICQYETSYYSSLNVLLHWYDLAALLAETVFFLLLARMVLGAEKQPKRVFAVSLITAVLLAGACVTRVAMALSGNQDALANSGLLTAPDLGVLVLALGVAKAYTPTTEQPQTSDSASLDDMDTSHPFLIPVDQAPVVDNVEEEFGDTPPKPLELEEMILWMMENPDDEEN